MHGNVNSNKWVKSSSFSSRFLRVSTEGKKKKADLTGKTLSKAKGKGGGTEKGKHKNKDQKRKEEVLVKKGSFDEIKKEGGDNRRSTALCQGLEAFTRRHLRRHTPRNTEKVKSGFFLEEREKRGRSMMLGEHTIGEVA